MNGTESEPYSFFKLGSTNKNLWKYSWVSVATHRPLHQSTHFSFFSFFPFSFLLLSSFSTMAEVASEPFYGIEGEWNGRRRRPFEGKNIKMWVVKCGCPGGRNPIFQSPSRLSRDCIVMVYKIFNPMLKKVTPSFLKEILIKL